MKLITADTWGVVYMLHFARPLGNLDNPHGSARHYIGWALDLRERLAEHRRGEGAAITRAAVERGIDLVLAASWLGTPAVERRLKSRKEGPRICPICARAHGRRSKHPSLSYAQLALPLEFDDFEFPASPPSRPDWYEISQLRRWRAQLAPASIAGLGDASCDIPY